MDTFPLRKIKINLNFGSHTEINFISLSLASFLFDAQIDHICLIEEEMDMTVMNQLGSEAYLGKTPLNSSWEEKLLRITQSITSSYVHFEDD